MADGPTRAVSAPAGSRCGSSFTAQVTRPLSATVPADEEDDLVRRALTLRVDTVEEELVAARAEIHGVSFGGCRGGHRLPRESAKGRIGTLPDASANSASEANRPHVCYCELMIYPYDNASQTR